MNTLQSVKWNSSVLFISLSSHFLKDRKWPYGSLHCHRDMWNYLDVIIEIIYILTVILRITTIARGGVPYNNRLLEISNYLYGINTLLMVLRVSSILELNQVAGPLQLALYRMLGDLLIILSQFFFVIVGFSLAITKSYNAERSYLRPHSNHSGTRVGKSVGWVFWSICSFYIVSLTKISCQGRTKGKGN